MASPFNAGRSEGSAALSASNRDLGTFRTPRRVPFYLRGKELCNRSRIIRTVSLEGRCGNTSRKTGPSHRFKSRPRRSSTRSHLCAGPGFVLSDLVASEAIGLFFQREDLTWWAIRSIMAAAETASAKIAPHVVKGCCRSQRRSRVCSGRRGAGMEFGGLGIEGDVAELLNDGLPRSLQPVELGLQ